MIRGWMIRGWMILGWRMGLRRACGAGVLALLAAQPLAATAQTAANNGAAAERAVATHGDWRVICPTQPTEGCFMVQIANGPDGSPLVEVSVVPLSGDARAAAGATAIVPLGTALPEGLAVQTDDGERRRYVFEFCAPSGCVANIALTPTQLQAMRAGAVTRLTLTPAARTDQPVTATLSLRGFTAAYAELEALYGR